MRYVFEIGEAPLKVPPQFDVVDLWLENMDATSADGLLNTTDLIVCENSYSWMFFLYFGA